MSLARAEIAEQPEAVARVVADADGAVTAAAEAIRRRPPRFVVIAARGSSDNAARYAQHVFGRLLGLPVALATPSLHTVYEAPVRYADGLVFGVSQSGASPDPVAVLDAGRDQGRITVAVTNEVASPMAAAATHVLPLQAVSRLRAVVPAQLLAVAAAERRGMDIDRPVGLQKVTRTT